VVESVSVIGAIGAVQSYTALRWLALLGDLGDWLADVAPATVDLFAVAMGLAALRARRSRDRDGYADGLALGYSVAAGGANLAAGWLDVSQHGYTGARVAVVLVAHTAPVITFLLGSHWLMRRSGAGHASGVAPVDAPPMSADAADARDGGTDTTPDADGTSPQPQPHAGTSTPASSSRPAREVVRRMVRRRGQDVTPAMVAARTGVSRRHAARLLAEERRPHVVEETTAGN